MLYECICRQEAVEVFVEKQDIVEKLAMSTIAGFPYVVFPDVSTIEGLHCKVVRELSTIEGFHCIVIPD